MKISISVIISFALGLGLGLAAMFIYIDRVLTESGQRSYVTNLDTTIRYLELLEKNDIESFKQKLRTKVDCGTAAYKDIFNNQGWKDTDYSKKILEKAKALYWCCQRVLWKFKQKYLTIT